MGDPAAGVIAPALLAFLLAAGLGLTLTIVAERTARRFGVVARPRADRWHRTTIPLLGGAAIVVATLVPMVASTYRNRTFLILALAAAGMAAVGFVDDLRKLSPQVKLLAQIILAVVLVQLGFVLRVTGYPLVDLFVTLFWIVGVTNAFNLLDNMDGLAATIAGVAVSFRLLFFSWEGDGDGMVVAAIFAGALAGYLVRNFPPAKIFMGDTGSLFLGFFLAGLSLTHADRAYSRGIAAVLVIPVLLLLIPIFDTAFVTITRILSGRSVAVGGRDHTSHRLIAIGLSERQTVLILALISAAAGGVAVLSYRAGLSEAVVLLALLVIGLVLLGVHLSRVRVVHTSEAREVGAVLRLLANFQYKRQVLTLSLDVCLIAISYYAAYLIRFEEAFPRYREQMYDSLGTVLLVQLLSLAGFHLYRGVWRYTGLSDVLRIVRAATVGTMGAMVALIYTHGGSGFSRTVFILDWLLLTALLVGSRASFRMFAEILRAKPASFARVLIYGAGGGGELLVREMLNNPALERIPVGFVDDDRQKHHTLIHGLPVLGSSDELERVLVERRVAEVIISTTKISGAPLEAALDTCRGLGVTVRRASLHLEWASEP